MTKPVKIEPISFRSGSPSQKSKALIFVKWLAFVFFGLVLILLCVSAGFVFTARQVVITLTPDPESISVAGGIFSPRIGNTYLMRPGEYRLKAIKPCFFPFDHTFQVSGEKHQSLNLKMKKLPGRLTIRAHPSDNPGKNITDADVYVDGIGVGKTSLENLEVMPGSRRIEIHAENYQDLQADVEVDGCSKNQKIDLAMLPAWSNIYLSSIPPDAMVQINGELFGNTPLNIQLLAGTYRLEIRAENYATWKHRLVVKPNVSQEIKDIRLQPAPGKLTVITEPAGANTLIDGTFIGRTPLEIDILPNKDHVIQISKAGYKGVTRKLRISSAASKQMHVNLKPRKGIIRLFVEPDHAELLVDGKSWGPVKDQLHLIAVEHTLEFKKKGYRPYRTRITPRPGFSQQLTITLQKEHADREVEPSIIVTQTGYRLKLIRPGPFTMGASRRVQGRRSNETLRAIKLNRPFYMGLKEVTNKAFREFMPGHNSGAFKSHPLNGAEQPVVRVTWEEAALFCNWLSARESLPPAYIKKGEKLVSVEPLNTSYRLPTEAEWEFCARFADNRTLLKYPWGNRFPPEPLSGNYADQSAKDLLPTVLKGYNDGVATTAPPAKFKPNGLGLFDLGGNVAEWCNDYYTIYSYTPEKTYVDPVGPKDGKLHVIRGSGWKHGSISTLRLAYRSYGVKKREDVGFRICRYLK